VALGLLTSQQAARLDPKEKVQLIFQAGLSTAPKADTLSGRGQGMAIAWEKIRDEGGELTVETWAGIGTRFILALPDTTSSPAEILAKSVPITT